MGTHRSYQLMIEVLLKLKPYWMNFDDLKIKEFKDTLLELQYEEENCPTNKDLALMIGIPQTKVNQYLRKIYDWLILEISEYPISVKKVICHFDIYIPSDESARQRVFEYDERSSWIAINLPILPRIGERIRLDFLEHFKFHQGIVHDISHHTDGVTQHIYLQIHPYNSYYYKWRKLEDEYEKYQSWKSRIGQSY